jgi:hypothetical protein
MIIDKGKRKIRKTHKKDRQEAEKRQEARER